MAIFRRLFDEEDFEEVEGSIDMIYGHIGGGKTYAATADILNVLERGHVVFASWPINFAGVNELDSRVNWFWGILGIKKYYKRIDPSNFHYIPLSELMEDAFVEKLEKMTDVYLYIDEAYAAKFLDSYVKTRLGIRQRMAIYGTRHFNRRIVIVAQRPNSIHVSARAMVNRFYKCERPFMGLQKLLHVIFFVKSEYQDMADETVNEETKPISTKFYFGRKRVFNAYNSKYLRGDTPRIYPPFIEEYEVGYFSRWKFLGRPPRLALKREPELTSHPNNVTDT